MKKSLLVIEDDKNISEIILELISKKFDDSVAVFKIDDAFKILNDKKFDLIILDINLAGRNGAEIIKHIITDVHNPNKETPFIISSGIINQSFISKNKNRFAGIIIKPFDHNELVAMVDNVLAGKKVENQNEQNFEEIPNVSCVLPFTIPQLEVKVTKVLEQVKKNNKLKELFASLRLNRDSDNYLVEHIGMLINISTAISIGMEWNTEKTLEKFVYAAYLHDMALNDRPDLAQINALEDLEKLKESLTSSEYNLVLNHPNIAADKIETINEIPADVSTMVRQHHETPKERGFPNKIGHSKISPLSSIFIVAHDLTDYIFANSNWTMEKYLIKYKMKFKGASFIKIQQVLEKIK